MSVDVPMTAKRPYLLRSLYEWIVDNQLTPHIVVNAEVPHCKVPLQFVKEGQIILNIAPAAVGALQMTNSDVQFNARFGGKSQQVYVPIAAVVAIYARENGAGTIFEEESALSFEQVPADEAQPMALVEETEKDQDKKSVSTSKSDKKPGKSKGSHLKVVK